MTALQRNRSNARSVLVWCLVAAGTGLAGCSAGVAVNAPFDESTGPSGGGGASSSGGADPSAEGGSSQALDAAGGAGGDAASGGSSSGSSGGGSSSSSSGSGAGAADAGGADAAADSAARTGDGGASLGYAANVAPILNPNCTNACHGGAGGLTIGYASIVNVKSGELASVNYVTPGAPGNSYLYCKVNPGDTACAGISITGTSMPPGGMLSAGNLNTIKNWIQQGAMP